MTDRIHDETLPDAVLYLTPGLAAGSDECCTTLSTRREPAATNALWIVYTGSPTGRLSSWIERTGEKPVRSAAITVGEGTRPPSSAGPSFDTVERINAPADLTGVGISVSELLSSWDDAGETMVCFDSITALLQYVDVETAYEFVHVLLGRLEALDAHSHFHLDPDAHDELVVEQLKTLFDAVVTYDGEGVSVRTAADPRE